MEKIKKYLNNPVFIVGTICLILGIVIIINTGFKLPDFYTDRQLADNIVQAVDSKQAGIMLKQLESNNHKFWSFVYQLFYFFLSVFIIFAGFRIFNFKDVKKLFSINNVAFVFLWINFAHIIYAIAHHYTYMQVIEKHVYNGGGDSLGIPFMSFLYERFLYAAIYIPVANFIAFIIFKTKIARIIYALPLFYWFYKMILIFIAACVAVSNFANSILFIYAFVNIFITISAFKILISKRKFKNLT